MATSSFRGRLAFCSNFYNVWVRYNYRSYRTAEHAYQANKMASLEDHNRVASQFTPGAAKRLARTLPMRPEWEAIKDTVMLAILRAKFSAKTLEAMLLDTGVEELVERNDWGDTYWGICDGVGQNKLGKLLMQVRSELTHMEHLK